MTQIPYKTRLKEVHIPNTDKLLIRALLDSQQYYDPHGHARRLGISPALWPLFGLLWPSSVHLAGHLALRDVCPDEKILEIGCGLALSSLVAHRRGARITASDRHPLAEDFLRHNLLLNQLAPRLRYRHGQWGLDKPMCPEIAGRPVLTERYNLIVGSDLLYERDSAPALARFIRQHALPRAEVWIVDANRGYRPAFNRKMQRQGFRLTEDIRLHNEQQQDRPYRGRLLKYRCVN